MIMKKILKQYDWLVDIVLSMVLFLLGLYVGSIAFDISYGVPYAAKIIGTVVLLWFAKKLVVIAYESQDEGWYRYWYRKRGDDYEARYLDLYELKGRVLNMDYDLGLLQNEVRQNNKNKDLNGK